MPTSRNRASRFLTDSLPICDQALPCLSDFYREEFMKCQRCLDEQREAYSDVTIGEVERALTLVITNLDRLCAHADGDKVVSRLLEQFGTVTHLSAWADPRHTH